jgi:MFS family permease
MTQTQFEADGGFSSKPYRSYVLGGLLLLFTFNFIDRILLGIVQEPIKQEFHLADWQLGLLGGPAFALLYTLLGIPIARLAETRSRVSIISISVALWSAMTAACGLATGYWQLLAARIGVSIGEAGCTPPAHSLLSDYYPPQQRATALSIYALGIPFGSAIAGLGGGWIADTYSWRHAFWLLGLPGILLAVLTKWTIKEPPRRGGGEAAPPFAKALMTLLRKPAFTHVAFGGALVSFFGYGAAQFLPSFLIRSHELSLMQASLVFAGISAVFVAFGTFLGGALTDRLIRRDLRAMVWLPAFGLSLTVPLYLASYLSTNMVMAFVTLCVGSVLHYTYLGPMYAVTQSVAPPQMRATATAVLLFIVNLIGYGLGPPLLGALSDAYAQYFGKSEGLRYALMTDACILLWAALHFLLAARTLKRDIVPV